MTNSYSFPLLKNPLQTLQQWAVALRKKEEKFQGQFEYVDFDAIYFTGPTGTGSLDFVRESRWRDVFNLEETEISLDFTIKQSLKSSDVVYVSFPESRPFKDDGVTRILGVCYMEISSSSIRGIGAVVKPSDSIYIALYLSHALTGTDSCIIRTKFTYPSIKR